MDGLRGRGRLCARRERNRRQGRLQHLRGVSSVICLQWSWSRTQVHLASDAFHSPDQPLLQLVLHSNGFTEGALFCSLGSFCNHVSTLWAGEEVHQVHNPFFVDVSGLQDVRGREVLLLRGIGFLCRRTDTEVATFVFVE